MIRGIDIHGLRGVAEGFVGDLGALTVLTGPNGCGKSTVLDALLLAVSSRPPETVAHVVARRPEVRNGARWLIRGTASDRTARLVATADDGTPEDRTLSLGASLNALHDGELLARLKEHGGLVASVQLRRRTEDRKSGVIADVYFAADNTYVGHRRQNAPDASVRLVDPGLPEPLDRLYSDAVRQGRKGEVLALLRDLLPDVEGIELLSEDDGTPVVYVVYPSGGVPVGLAGDGVQSLVQTALGLASQPGGLVLIEEPEVYQHPRAIRLTAKALVAAVRRGVQVVCTTHSLELIDGIVEALGEADLGKLVLFNLALEAGQLRSVRWDGTEVAFARSEIERDLR